MYWTDWGSNPKIEKANMAGKERRVLVNSVLYWPNGLTLDKDTNRLYWVDGSYHKLEYLDLDNNNRVTLLISSSVLPHPFGLTLLGDHVYWTDWSTNAVYRANKESVGIISAFISGIGQPMDIHGYNTSAPIVPGNEDNSVMRKPRSVLLFFFFFFFFALDTIRYTSKIRQINHIL